MESKSIFPLGPASLSSSQKTFEWLIAPRTIDEFLQFHDSQILHISRPDEPEYYAGLVSQESAAKKQASSSDNSVFDAETKFSWLHALCERLENYTHSIWTAQVVLLAPDKVASLTEFASEDTWTGMFLLQVSGTSAVTLESADQPISLTPGSLLYAPADQTMVEVATGVDGTSGISIVLRCGKNETFADLISLALPKMLTVALEQDGEFRRSLPLGWRGRIGRCLPKKKRKREEVEELTDKVTELVGRLIGNFFDLEELADEMSTEFIAERLPPAPRKGGGKFGPDPRTTPVAALRWRNPAWVRVVEGKDEDNEDITLIFGSVDNKLANHAANRDDSQPPLTLEIPGKMHAPLTALFEAYPQFSGAGALPGAVVAALWDAALVETQAQKTD